MFLSESNSFTLHTFTLHTYLLHTYLLHTYLLPTYLLPTYLLPTNLPTYLTPHTVFQVHSSGGGVVPYGGFHGFGDGFRRFRLSL